MSSSSVLRHVIQAKSPSESSSPGIPGVPAPDGEAGLQIVARFGDQLAALVENAPVALSLFDEQMRYMVANRAWIEEFGLQHVQPIIGRSQYEIFPGLHPGWKQVYERALQGHIVRSEHDAISGQDGKAIVYRWEVRPWRNADASVGGLMVICEKTPSGLVVSAEVAKEDAKPESQAVKASLPKIVECAVPMVVVDDVGRILEANQTAMLAAQRMAPAAVGLFFWEVFADSDHLPATKDQLFTAITKICQDRVAGPQTLVTRTQPSNDNEAVCPSGICQKWTLTKITAAEEPAQFLAICVPSASPFEISGSPLEPAKEFALPAPAGPTPGSNAAETAVISELQEKLNRTRQEVTVLREAEQAFAKREGRQRAVLEAMHSGIVVLDERGMPIYHNQSIAKALGRPIQRGESVEQWLMHACSSQEHKEKVASLWAQDVWSRQLVRTISLITAQDGVREFEFRPIALHGGGVLISIQDVTEHCRAEELLQSTEARVRVLMQESAEGILLADKTGAIFDANQAAEKLTGCPKADLRRVTIDDCLSADSAVARREIVRAMRDEGRRAGSVEVGIRKPDGSSDNAILRIATVTDGEGELHCTLYLIAKLPSPIVQATPSLAETPAAVSVESAPSSQVNVQQSPPSPTEPRVVVRWLAQTEESGRVASWSADAQSVFGFEASEAVGKWMHTIFRPSDASGFYGALQDQMRRPDEAVSWNFFGKDGRRGSGRFFVKASGEGGFSIDLYDEHETTTSALNNEIAHAEPRTHIVKPSQLWPVCDLDREKLLLSETHHRIKNHLQIISSMLNLQMNSLCDEGARSALRSSQNRVRSIAALHQHLYQLALGEGPGFDDFARGLSQRLRECYEVHEDHVALNLDITAAHLQQEWMMPLALILNETLSNAFEHAFPSGRQGHVNVRLMLGDDGVGEFEVSDDGIGLPDGFDPAIAPGLGLKILGVFADQMRGQLRLSGEPGLGTKFNLRFPMAHPDN